MVVCSCNVFSDKNVRDCLNKANAPTKAKDVYPALGCSPQCGRCARTITDMIKQSRDVACDVAVVGVDVAKAA